MAQLLYVPTAIGADAHGPPKPKPAPEEPPIPKGKALESLPPGDQYCAKIGEIAANSQFSQQRKALAKAQEQLEARIKLLTEKTDEYKAWSKKYDEFTKKATDTVLQIYLKMNPEVAAKQLLAMAPSMAAAIVAKLPPKTSSAILAEMEPARAARLSATLGSAFKQEDAAPPAATPPAPAAPPPTTEAAATPAPSPPPSAGAPQPPTPKDGR